jgi:hypothetical protein
MIPIPLLMEIFILDDFSIKFAQERSSEPGGVGIFSFPELVATGGFPAINDEGFGDVTLGLASRE